MDIGLFLRVIGPLLTVGITLLWWLAIVTMQTPRRYWRDRLHISIVGTLVVLAVYLIARALARVGWVAGDTQVIVMIGAVFSALGWPTLWRETRKAYAAWQQGERG